MIKTIVNSLLITITLLLSPVLSDRIIESYYKEMIYTKVVPLTSRGRRYCSASNIQYKNKVYLVTNRHCCQRGKRGFATYLETSFNQKHEVLKVSDKHDICIASSIRQRGLLVSTNYNLGDEVKVIGYPRGLNKTIRKGYIFDISYASFNWLPRKNTAYKYIYASSIMYPGNSGSPIVDRLGRVVGIVFAGMRGIHTEAMVVPSEYIIDAIESIK